MTASCSSAKVHSLKRCLYIHHVCVLTEDLKSKGNTSGLTADCGVKQCDGNEKGQEHDIQHSSGKDDWPSLSWLSDPHRQLLNSESGRSSPKHTNSNSCSSSDGFEKVIAISSCHLKTC